MLKKSKILSVKIIIVLVCEFSGKLESSLDLGRGEESSLRADRARE